MTFRFKLYYERVRILKMVMESTKILGAIEHFLLEVSKLDKIDFRDET